MAEGKVVSGVLLVMIVSRVVVVTRREMKSEELMLCGEGKSVRRGSRVRDG